MHSTTIKDFNAIKKIGDGAFSQVYEVLRHSDSQIYALKKVKLGLLKSREKENAINEVRILASIKHPNIVPYKEAFYDETSNSLCIIMEFVSGGTLSHLLEILKKSGNKLDETVIWNYISQLLKGLKALHDLDILHRDLKSANIFLTKDQKTLKIADMNVSKVAKAGFLYTQTGTPYYASPEIWRDEPYNGKSDIWSLGCVLYEMCTLKPPFVANDMQDLYNKIQKGNVQRIPMHYSNQLQDFIHKCLAKHPSKRPSCEGLLRMLGDIRKLNERTEENINRINDNVLLKTLKFPKNPKSLVDILPKSNYEKKNMSFDHVTNTSILTNKEVVEGLLPVIATKRAVSRIIPRSKGKIGSGKREDKENIDPVSCNKQVKMPKITSNPSKSPNIFRV